MTVIYVDYIIYLLFHVFASCIQHCSTLHPFCAALLLFGSIFLLIFYICWLIVLNPFTMVARVHNSVQFFEAQNNLYLDGPGAREQRELISQHFYRRFQHRRWSTLRDISIQDYEVEMRLALSLDVWPAKVKGGLSHDFAAFLLMVDLTALFLGPDCPKRTNALLSVHSWMEETIGKFFNPKTRASMDTKYPSLEAPFRSTSLPAFCAPVIGE